MRQFILKSILFSVILLAAGNTYAQALAAKTTTAEDPTPANVLKWTKEVLPKMQLLVPKLEKIKADSQGKPAAGDALRLLAQVNHLKAINTKGKKLKTAEAKRYYDLIAATVNSFYIECKSQNNGVCCVDCHNHGILGIWCFANCFVAKFPSGD